MEIVDACVFMLCVLIDHDGCRQSRLRSTPFSTENSIAVKAPKIGLCMSTCTVTVHASDCLLNEYILSLGSACMDNAS
jgi:hypothetical protein